MLHFHHAYILRHFFQPCLVVHSCYVKATSTCVNHRIGLDTYDELNVLWEMHMEAEGSLTVAQPKCRTYQLLEHANDWKERRYRHS